MDTDSNPFALTKEEEAMLDPKYKKPKRKVSEISEWEIFIWCHTFEPLFIVVHDSFEADATNPFFNGVKLTGKRDLLFLLADCCHVSVACWESRPILHSTWFMSLAGQCQNSKQPHFQSPKCVHETLKGWAKTPPILWHFQRKVNSNLNDHVYILVKRFAMIGFMWI